MPPTWLKLSRASTLPLSRAPLPEKAAAKAWLASRPPVPCVVLLTAVAEDDDGVVGARCARR